MPDHAVLPIVAVVGATGFTGRLTVGELAGRPVALRLVGRDRGRLEDVAAGAPGAEVRPVAWERGALAAALEGCAAVISCAGPFMEVGRPVVEAAVDARVPYTDSTGEQPFIRDVYDRLDGPARAAGIPLVPAFGFDYVPGDLGAAIAAEGLGPLSRIDVVYAVERADTSVGTRRSVIGMMAQDGFQRIDGALRRERVGARRRSVPTPWGRRTAASIPGGEPLSLARHLDVDTVVSHMAMPGRFGPANPAAALVLPALRLAPVRALLDRAAARGPVGPTGDLRDTRVCCVVQVTARSGERRAVRVEGRDAYGFTARALAGLATRFAEDGVDAVGGCAPAQVVEARAFLASTGLEVVEIEPE